MDPKHDLSLSNKTFIIKEFENLRMPIEDGSNAGIISSFRDKYVDLAQAYQKDRNDLYDKYYKDGLDLQSLALGILTQQMKKLLIFQIILVRSTIQRLILNENL